MGGFILGRIVSSLPVLVGASLVVFLLVRLVPGDPARAALGEDASEHEIASMRHQLGLDEPLYVQYVDFAGRALTGDLGRSIRTRRQVANDLAQRFPATLQLAATAVAFAFVTGCVGGVVGALRRHHPLGLGTSLAMLIGISLPSFWVGLLMILVFAVWLRWLPAGGRESPTSVILPALTLGLALAAVTARLMRSSLVEILSHDYLRTARAKGLAARAVLGRHALKNALIPVVTVLGLELGSLLGGAVVIETVFAWPGIGRYVVDAVTYRDYPAVQGTVLLASTVFVLVNLGVDLVYGWLDPRIRYA
jgi:ABC-type dipeptide/oligopeptide/nickel transport system permease component